MAAESVPADAGRRGRWSWGTPLSYLVGIVVAVVTVVPIGYVFVGGFRTTGQLANRPYALPDPWVPANYT